MQGVPGVGDMFSKAGFSMLTFAYAIRWPVDSSIIINTCSELYSTLELHVPSARSQYCAKEEIVQKTPDDGTEARNGSSASSRDAKIRYHSIL